MYICKFKCIFVNSDVYCKLQYLIGTTETKAMTLRKSVGIWASEVQRRMESEESHSCGLLQWPWKDWIFSAVCLPSTLRNESRQQVLWHTASCRMSLTSFFFKLNRCDTCPVIFGTIFLFSHSTEMTFFQINIKYCNQTCHPVLSYRRIGTWTRLRPRYWQCLTAMSEREFQGKYLYYLL